MNLRNDDVLEDVIHLPVTQLVAKNGQDFRIAAALLFVLVFVLLFPFLFLFLFLLSVFFSLEFVSLRFFQKGVEQNDSLESEESVEVSVAVGRPLGAFDDEKLVERKLDFRGKIFNFFSQFTFRQRCVLVEQRRDEFRVDDHHEEGEADDEEPEVDEEVVAAPLNDLDDGGHQRKSDHLGQEERLDLVLGVKSGGLLRKEQNLGLKIVLHRFVQSFFNQMFKTNKQILKNFTGP